MFRHQPLISAAARSVGAGCGHLSRSRQWGRTYPFGSAMSTTSTAPTPASISFSDGESPSELTPEVDALIRNDWTLDTAKKGVEKTFHFKTYTKALDFVSLVGIRSKSKNHHPVMTIRSGSVSVHWTTHLPPGLSAKDTFMARHCDDQARLVGTVDRAGAQSCHGRARE